MTGLKMKKLLKLLFILLLLIYNLNSFAGDLFSGGLKGGYLNNKFNTTISLNELTTNGFKVGGFLRTSVKKFYIQPEINYVYNGGILSDEMSVAGVVSNYNTVINFSSIEIPVTIGYKILNLNKTNLRVFAGTSLNSLLSTNIDDEEFDTISIDDFKNQYLGWKFGIGADIRFITIDLYLDYNGNIVKNLMNYKASNTMLVGTIGVKLF